MSTIREIYDAKVAAGEITPDPAQEAVLPEFERMRTGLAEAAKGGGWFRRAPEPPKGLYLWGGVGRGKSMLMDLFVNALDVPAMRVHFHEFMQEIHRGMHQARKDGVQDALMPVAKRVAAKVRCLAFDEMQITDITDAMIVGRLFEVLMKAGVVIVTTSNRIPDDLYKDGLNRQLFLPFIALFKEQMVVHELASPNDYRQDRIAGGPTYFTPVGEEARERMEALWAELTGNAAQRPLMLTVNKREVEIPAFYNGVARGRFHEFCGRMLGAADYLAIAEAARVVMMEDIPCLGRTNFNEAKRFVTLIDALYEAKVRFIASAQAQPEYLYLEGEGSFEFERTASRLREMQSAGWGA